VSPSSAKGFLDRLASAEGRMIIPTFFTQSGRPPPKKQALRCSSSGLQLLLAYELQSRGQPDRRLRPSRGRSMAVNRKPFQIEGLPPGLDYRGANDVDAGNTSRCPNKSATASGHCGVRAFPLASRSGGDEPDWQSRDPSLPPPSARRGGAVPQRLG